MYDINFRSGMALLLLVNILSTMYDGYEYLQGRYKHVLGK